MLTNTGNYGVSAPVLQLSVEWCLVETGANGDNKAERRQ